MYPIRCRLRGALFVVLAAMAGAILTADAPGRASSSASPRLDSSAPRAARKRQVTDSTSTGVLDPGASRQLQRALGMLQYIVGDYVAAVTEDGKILDRSEYQEQIAL